MIQTKTHLILVLSVLSLVACGDPVPKVEDPSNIVVNGQPMLQMAFLQKYCMDKTDHPTCIKVSRAMAIDSGKSKSAPIRF